MNKAVNSNNIKEYLQQQQEVCLSCELFSDKFKHGSKVIMLFAEVFSFLVDIYGVKNTANLIKQYSSTSVFKNWFWRIKHLLGEQLNTDPSFDDIGNWIGKGFFLKISLSLIIIHKLYLEEAIINDLIKKQNQLIKSLQNSCSFTNWKKCMYMKNDYYSLLNDKTILSYKNELFYLENIIR